MSIATKLPVSLAEMVSEINQMKADRAALIENQKREVESASREIARAVEQFESLSHGLYPEIIAIAEGVLKIRGTYHPCCGESDGVVSDAMSDLADNDGDKLRECYFGVKDYARWSCQREDHQYGYGPKHGYIVFSVELQQRFRGEDRVDLTYEEKEAAIYYLANLVQIQKAKAVASQLAARH